MKTLQKSLFQVMEKLISISLLAPEFGMRRRKVPPRDLWYLLMWNNEVTIRTVKFLKALRPVDTFRTH